MPPFRLRRPLADAASAVLLVALLAGAAGCSRDGAGADAGAGAATGAAGGGPGGGPGGPGASAVVLAATDVATAERGSIEAGTAVTGDLTPIEEVTVRARLEGDLQEVLVREGDRVGQGQLLARFESTQEESDRASAEADRAAAASELTTAKWNADQAQELFQAGAISEQAYRAAQQGSIAAQARLAAADARLRSTGRQERDTRVLSPTAGVVGQRLVERGEHVARGASLFTVVRNDRLELRADVPARQANSIRPGQVVRFVADGTALEGRVARVSPTVNPATRAVAIYVQVDNPGGRLRGNTFATGRIIGQAIPDAVLVPVTAIRQSGDAEPPFIYRIAGDRLERAEVRVGVVDEVRGVAQIADGIAVGDRIVVGNVGAIGTGSQVQIVGERAAPAATAPAPTAPAPTAPAPDRAPARSSDSGAGRPDVR
ncbi:MAG: efflux RND transporter periplasmic adaptor subunit [Gemmatimonadaceae bacterium]